MIDCSNYRFSCDYLLLQKEPGYSLQNISQYNTEHVKNLNLIIFKFKTLQSVSPVIGIISGICQK